MSAHLGRAVTCCGLLTFPPHVSDASCGCAVPRRQLERWQRQRQFAVLLAEDAATGRLLGSVTLSLTRCEAALPPPLPTSKPLRSQKKKKKNAPDATAASWTDCRCVGLVGYAANSAEPAAAAVFGRLYVSNMVVDPDARRRGVATELLGACMRLGEPRPA